METIKINFEVELQNIPSDMENIYLVGNDKKIGAWDALKAVALKKTKTSSTYKGSRTFNKGSIIEYKILKEQSWDTVEKGSNFEEITNRSFTVNEPETIKIVVKNFK